MIAQPLRSSERVGSRFVAPRGDKARSLQNIAQSNAEYLLKDRILERNKLKKREAMQDLARFLELPSLPKWIECYDISHIQGQETVASSVCFLKGSPHPPSYRHYRIRSVEGIDDPASIAEVIRRRLQGLTKSEGKGFPDIFVIDGGATQVNAAFRVAQVFRDATGQTGPQFYFVGLAKKREELYFPLENQAHRFHPERPGMLLLRQARDEAHRFALGYHQARRNKAMLRHAIGRIPNIGAERQKALLKHFQEQNIENASIEELSAVPGIAKGLGRRIHSFFAEMEKTQSQVLEKTSE